MKTRRSFRAGWMAAGLVLAFVGLLVPTAARANVYATDIQLNGSLTGVGVSVGNPVTITYRLNEAATGGVTVKVMKGSTVAATIAGGTAMGLNTVSWTASGSGTYSVNITAAAAGFPVWTQTSIDTNAAMPAYYPEGIDVDKNTNSPYYGRVVMGCALPDTGNANPFVPAFARQDGLYKMNADGTYADEGGFGNAGYTTDNAFDGYLGTQTTNQMPDSGGYNPWGVRIGDDDRIYWCDNSAIGAIIACDMLATTNQPVIVLNNGNFGSNPDISDLNFGVRVFDVTGLTTTNAAVWLCDNGDFPNWGIWMFHLTNGAVDPNDTLGSQVVQSIYDNNSSAQHPSDMIVATGGCSVDNNLDVFVSTDRAGANPTATVNGVTMPLYQTMRYPSWNGGVLPAENSDEALTWGLTNGQVTWGDQVASTSDYSWETIVGTVINNRKNPTLVALPMANGNDNGSGGGVKVVNAGNPSLTITSVTLNGTNLNINFTSSNPYAPVLSQLSLLGSAAVAGPYAPVAATFTGGFGVFKAVTAAGAPAHFYQIVTPPTQGTVITVENSAGTVTQSLTNIDWGNTYTCAAWDNVGNLYAASSTTNCWRVWSPPGPNTNTTVAVPTVTVSFPTVSSSAR